MKSLVFLLVASVSIPVLAHSSQFTQLVAGEVSLQRYLHERLAPMLCHHVMVAGKASGIEARVVERVLNTMAAANALVPEAWVLDGVLKIEEDRGDDFLVERMGQHDPLGGSYGSEDVENMIGEIEEFMRDDKIAAFIDVHEDVVAAVYKSEHYSTQESAQVLGIDNEQADRFVRATAMLTRKDRLLTQHLIEDIAEQELIESIRLLLHEYQDLIEPSLRAELLEALELDSYPAGILGDELITPLLRENS